MKDFYTCTIKFLTILLATCVFVSLATQNSVAQTSDDTTLMPPANDMFDSAELIAGPDGYVTGTNLFATSEPNEPLFYKGDETVWYRWTAPANTSMTFELRTMDDSAPGIAIYEGPIIAKLTPMGHGLHFDRVTFVAQGGIEYMIQVSSKFGTAGGFTLGWDINGAESWRQFDFDGPPAQLVGLPRGKSDFAIYRYPTVETTFGEFWIWQSSTGTSYTYHFARHSDNQESFYPGDFDGDGRVDIAVFDHPTNIFWVLQSGTNTAITVQWGLPTDIRVQGDFDGDDMADFAIFRDGVFWVLKSTDGQALVVQWGTAGDIPVCGDYDGDGLTDFAVKRPTDDGRDRALYYVLGSYNSQYQVFQFGFMTDMTVPGDYDRDGKNDLAVFRPTNSGFYYLRSSDGADRAIALPYPFEKGDRILPGDYFGGPASDLVIWQHTTGDNLGVADGGYGQAFNFHFGLHGDQPLAFSNVH
jgi:hypothetical protein